MKKLALLVLSIFAGINAYTQVDYTDEAVDTLGNIKLYITKKNKRVDNIGYDNVALDNGYAFVMTSGSGKERWGVYSADARLIVPVKYDLVEPSNFESGEMYFTAVADNKKTLFDKNGNVVGNENYSAIYSFCGGKRVVAVAQRGEQGLKYGFVDLITRKEISGCEFDTWESYGNDFVVVRKEGKAGLLNASGIVISPQYSMVSKIDDNAIFIIKANETDTVYSLFNASEKRMLSGTYEEAESVMYTEDKTAILAKKDGKYGMIDAKGNVLIPFEYSSSFYFDKGKAQVSNASGTFYIDRKNRKEQ